MTRRLTQSGLATMLVAGALAAPAAAQRVPDIPTALPNRSDTTGQGIITAASIRPREISLDDLGPDLAGRVLRAALTRPHVVVVAPDTGLTLAPGVTVDRSLIIVGGPARIAAQIRGDLVVLGSLYLRPGAAVEGRAVAIGGGVYNSTLAMVRGDITSFRDVSFERSGDDAGAAISLRSRVEERSTVNRLTLPGFFGFRIPSYDRIDGLSVTAGPELALGEGRFRFEPTATYRSHLGAVDPALRAIAELSARNRVDLRAERTTATNEAWIRSDLTNSLAVFVNGTDVRNYYRADRADLRFTRRYEVSTAIFEPFVGALVERAWSAARDTGSTATPYSILSRGDSDGVRRANPRVTGGRITSAIGGIQARAEAPRFSGRATALVERSLEVQRGRGFTQLTVDADVTGPAFLNHRFEVLAHGVATSDDAPTQRNVYLGGGGTIPSLQLLELGGNELLWGEARYTIPFEFINLPFGGPPSVTLRAIGGGAGENGIHAFTPNLGIRLSVAALRADYVFDPRGRGENRFSVGVGLR